MTAELALQSTRGASAPPPFAPLRALLARLARRSRARLRLAVRRRRAGPRFGELQQLDDATLRDLGLSRSELYSAASEAGGLAAASRRQTDLDVWLSASSRFRIRTIDSCL
jgi:uncharacterized protein YjiS (DUF1127 family)